MVQVRVRQKDVVKPLEADSAAQNLPLCAFATINEEALLFREYSHCRQAAMDRRRRGRRAQKYQLEHSTAAFFCFGRRFHIDGVKEYAIAVGLVIHQRRQSFAE